MSRTFFIKNQFISYNHLIIKELIVDNIYYFVTSFIPLCYAVIVYIVRSPFIDINKGIIIMINFHLHIISNFITYTIKLIRKFKT